MKKYFVVSDTHFNHRNIIKYCNRPFASIDEMNSELIARWNSVVGKDDVVYHLGDFAFGPSTEHGKFLSKLNGKIRLVLGNHDCHKVSWYYGIGFEKVYDKPIIINDNAGHKFILTHRPLEVEYIGNFINIYGHIHNSIVDNAYTKHQACVCVERHNYTPVELNSIFNNCAMANDDVFDFQQSENYVKFNEQ